MPRKSVGSSNDIRMSTRLIFLSRQISLGTADLPIPGLPQRKSGCTDSGESSAFSIANLTDFGLICYISLLFI
jgi:hypothetical protein